MAVEPAGALLVLAITTNSTTTAASEPPTHSTLFTLCSLRLLVCMHVAVSQLSASSGCGVYMQLLRRELGYLGASAKHKESDEYITS